MLSLFIFTACDETLTGSQIGDPSSAEMDANPSAEPPETFTLPPEWEAEHPVLSPNARIETHLHLLEEKKYSRSPGDGGGRMWIERILPIGGDSGAQESQSADTNLTNHPLLAASTHRFEMVYEVGEHGIEEGGWIFIEAEPFWDWSPSQTESQDYPGFTTVHPRKPDVTLEPRGTTGAFQVQGRALKPGERIDVVYGDGPRGARIDRYAERDAEILVAVDADNDGFRAWSGDVPRIEILPHHATMIVAFAPAEVAPGDSFEIQIAAVDALGNHAAWPSDNPDLAGQNSQTGFDIDLLATSSTEVEIASPNATADGGERGVYRIKLEAPKDPGTLRLEVRGHGAFGKFRALVNPIVIRRAETRLFWADLHGHSTFSDGTGQPEDYFAYARDVARLDAVALTDHDHWGIRPLDETPEHAEVIRQQIEAFHDPQHFVTIPGYEWTSWLHGHRHVLYFDESSHESPIFSSIDSATDRPDELWKALKGKPALTFAHHSAGDPVATNWFYFPDPVLEPITEIVSVHGESEAGDSNLPVTGAIRGNFVRDILMRGARLGFIGSGDSHDGHPGLVELSGGPNRGGLAGIHAKSLDRESLLEALRERRTFATNGIRAWLEVRIDETFMGGTLPANPTDQKGASQHLTVRFEATAPIERIDLVRSGIIASLPGDERLSLDLVREIPALQPGEFHYVRILQTDGGVAWSSPIFVENPASAVQIQN